MARNEEKANAALNRWVTMKTAERLGFHDKRPLRMTEVTSIVEAEKWRGEVLREISQKASQIQNAFLGEQRIRDLNDTINGLLQEKRRWERRIVELGGPNHGGSTSVYDSKGNVIAGGGSAREYKYFGAARDLPGVREVLAEREKEAKERALQRRRQRGGGGGGGQKRGEEGSARTVRRLTPEYYGYAGPDDDDDFETALCEEEDRCEAAAVAAAQREWDAAHAGGAHSGGDGEEGCWDDDDGYDERLQRALEFVERV